MTHEPSFAPLVCALRRTAATTTSPRGKLREQTCAPAFRPTVACARHGCITSTGTASATTTRCRPAAKYSERLTYVFSRCPSRPAVQVWFAYMLQWLKLVVHDMHVVPDVGESDLSLIRSNPAFSRRPLLPLSRSSQLGYLLPTSLARPQDGNGPEIHLFLSQCAGLPCGAGSARSK